MKKILTFFTVFLLQSCLQAMEMEQIHDFSSYVTVLTKRKKAALEFVQQAKATKLREEKIALLKKAADLLEPFVEKNDQDAQNCLAVVLIEEAQLIEDITEKRKLLQRAQKLAEPYARLGVATAHINAMIAYLEEVALADTVKDKIQLLEQAQNQLTFAVLLEEKRSQTLLPLQREIQKIITQLRISSDARSIELSTLISLYQQIPLSF